MSWRRLLAALGVFLAVVLIVPNFLPRRVFYQNRRPTRVGMLVVRAYGAFAALGLPPSWNLALEVTGKKTGKTYSIPLAAADYEGERYLVSMMGKDVAWVRNVHAAGGRATIRHGSRTPVVLEDVPVELRAPILKAYLRRAPGARPHIPVGYRAPVAAFERIAADYPVFRVTQPAS